jgi:hypothetical protein
MSHSPLAEELRDAVTPRAVLLMVGVLLVQLGFLLSYVGAFHHPDAHRVPLAVAGPPGPARQLDRLPGQPVATTLVADRAAARRRILHRDAQGAYVVNPHGTRDTLLIASAAGSSVTGVVRQVGAGFAQAQGRRLRVVDVVPVGDSDQSSLTSFYLVVGWLVGGYLAASMLGVTAGARPANRHRALIRLVALLPYAALSGLGGAIIVDPALGALTGHFLQLWGLGALVVFTAGAVTIALQALFGVLGIGLAVVIFVVLGNPSSGGAYQPHMIPPFWTAIGPWLPAGAGVSAVRNVVYFHGNALTWPLGVLGVWAVAGVLLSLLCAREPDTRVPALRSGYGGPRDLRF